jgi:RNA polymerase sigma-70 factor (ECF subfamily)
MAYLHDPQRFEAAYRRLAPVCLRIAQRVLRDRAAAEDVVQDVFLQLWRNPGAYDPARGPVATYVTMLVRSRSIDRQRSRATKESAFARLTHEERANSPRSADAADEVALRRATARQMLSTMNTLPAEQRTALLLAYGRGLTAGEIARAEKLPLGTAKSRIRTALARMREHVDEAA